MASNINHKALLVELHKQLKPIFDSSEQGLYLYMDDVNKVCNGKFSGLLGYKSPKEWAQVIDDIPSVFAENKSVPVLITAFQNALEKKIASTVKITWKKKNGGKVNTIVVLVPLHYKGHLFALHFVSKI